jgi:DNA-directed RNA polymerase subunit beta'
MKIGGQKYLRRIVMARKSPTLMSLDDVYEQLKKEFVQLKDIFAYVHSKKTKGRTKNLTLGRIWFNCILPDNFRLINEPVNKKLLNSITNEIYNKLSAEAAAEALTIINKESFKMASIIPQTFTIEDLIIPQRIKDRKKEEIHADVRPEEFGNKMTNIAQDYIDSYLGNTGIGNILNSGAKGSATDFGVLTVAKGPTVNIDGEISDPILSSLADGYNGEEYYAAAGEARRVLHIRAVGTAEPGHLAKTVTFANANTSLDPEDCKTKKYLELFVKPSMVDRLLGRWMMNDRTNKIEEITDDSNIVNKTIQVRSPLFCKSKPGICPICYGELAKRLDSKNLGLLAGASINSAGIEGYAMKARHESSQVKLREVNFEEDILRL